MIMIKEHNLYNGKVNIYFNKDKHIFKDEKGNYLISVTGATGIIDKSGPLIPWAINLMGQYLIDNYNNKAIDDYVIQEAKKKWRQAKQEAADIGTEIHKWIEKWINKEKPEMPENEKVVNGITAFLKFQKKHKIKVKNKYLTLLIDIVRLYFSVEIEIKSHTSNFLEQL